MPNICENRITIIGLKEPPENFVKAFSKALFALDLDNLDPTLWEQNSVNGTTWYASLVEEYQRTKSYPLTYCILFPHEPYGRFRLWAPRFYVDTKWQPPIDELLAASEQFTQLTFHLAWRILQDGPTGELVIRNGKILEELRRPSSWYLFDSLLYPGVDLLRTHMPYTLVQHAMLRLEEAINIVNDLSGILDDSRFKSSPYTPFSDFRDQQKTARLQAGLAALHDSMVDHARRLDFQGVFLEQGELIERYSGVQKDTETLMQSVGIELLLPGEPGKTMRFCVLPYPVALMADPYRLIVLVVRYTSAAPTSGGYDKSPDASDQPIEWEIRYVCLTRAEMEQLNRLPNQGLYDIEMIASPNGVGYELRPITRARWKDDPNLAKRIEQKAAETSEAFAAKLAGMPSVTVLSNYLEAEARRGQVELAVGSTETNTGE
jgi:hypothetical protein